MEDILKAIASGLKLDAAKFLADFKNGDDFKGESEIAETLTSFISEKVKAANETARKAGRSESSAKVARLVKNSGFENPDGLQGDALLTAFLEWKDEQSQPVEGDPKGMTKQDLLKLPVVRELLQEGERKASEKWAAEKKEFEAKVEAANNTRKKILLRRTLEEMSAKAKLNMGETPETKAVRLDFLESRVDFSRLEVGEKDSLKYLDSEGFETELDKEVLPLAVTAFGIVTQDPKRGGSGAQGSRGNGGNGDGKDRTVFDSPQTFDKAFLAETDPAKRAKMQGDWIQQQKEAAG